MIIYDVLHCLRSPVVNVFLFAYQLEIKDEMVDQFILIDTGMLDRPKILPYLAQLGHAPDAITHILITHADVDHVGNLATIQQTTGATIIAGAKTAELLTAGETSAHGKKFISNLSERFTSYHAVPQSAIQIVAHGDVLPLMGGLHVVASPGHTSDHIAFHAPVYGIVFAGDAIAATANGFKLHTISNAENNQAIISAMSLLDLTPVLFACGHGKPHLHTIEQVETFFSTLRQ